MSTMIGQLPKAHGMYIFTCADLCMYKRVLTNYYHVMISTPNYHKKLWYNQLIQNYS